MSKSAPGQTVAPMAPLPANWPAMSIEAANARLTAPGARYEIEELIIRGVPTKAWKNCPPTLRHVFEIGRGFRDRTFLVYEDERATFDAFARAVLALAYELQQQGVVKGDRVAIVMRNLPEWPVAFFAAALCGAIVTPLNAWWTGAEIEYGLTNAGAKIAVIDAERYERIAEHLPNCPDLKRVYVARENEDVADPRVIKLERVLGGVTDWGRLPERDLPDVALDADAAALGRCLVTLAAGDRPVDRQLLDRLHGDQHLDHTGRAVPPVRILGGDDLAGVEVTAYRPAPAGRHVTGHRRGVGCGDQPATAECVTTERGGGHRHAGSRRRTGLGDLGVVHRGRRRHLVGARVGARVLRRPAALRPVRNRSASRSP